MADTQTQTLTVLEEEQQQAEKRLQLKQDSLEALAVEINNTYAECCTIAEQTQQVWLFMENQRIRIGTLLRTAKDQVKHGEFMKWVQDNCPDISERTANRCMQVAKEMNYQQINSLDGLKEYHKVLVRLGLKEPNEGHGPQVLHDFNGFAVFTKTIADTRRKIAEIFEKQPLDEWEDDAKEQLKAQLEPLVKLYEDLD
jgi:hypothetical protein